MTTYKEYLNIESDILLLIERLVGLKKRVQSVIREIDINENYKKLNKLEEYRLIIEELIFQGKVVINKYIEFDVGSIELSQEDLDRRNLLLKKFIEIVQV